MMKLRQVIALLTVFCIVGLAIATLVCGITGSKYFFGVLFLTLVVPVILWVFMWFTKLISNQDADMTGQNEENE